MNVLFFKYSRFTCQPRRFKSYVNRSALQHHSNSNAIAHFSTAKMSPKGTLQEDVKSNGKRPLKRRHIDCNNNTENPNAQKVVEPESEKENSLTDLHSLFDELDKEFFGGKIKGVNVELVWSKRMSRAAGRCHSRRNKFGTFITIRISEPLLKSRPRSDLINTLLHEMIHAFLFIQKRNDIDDHGENFTRMMNEINRVGGKNVTVYHSFYKEMALHRAKLKAARAEKAKSMPSRLTRSKTRKMAENSN